MVEKKAAEDIATARVCQLLLAEYAIKTSDAGKNWLVQYVPVARVRGGGFEITVAKDTGDVLSAIHMQ